MRAMTVADIEAVDALEQQLFPIDAWPLFMFHEELAQPTRAYFVITDPAAAIVGYAGLMCIPPVGDVQTIAVIPELEGRGLGTALLTRLIDEAGERGANEMLLEVRADNPRAQRLYERYGFTQIHQRKGYYRDGVDALIMKSELLTDCEGH